MALIRLKTAGVMLGPPEAGQFGHSGLTVAISARAEAFEFMIKLEAGDETGGLLDLAEATGDQDGAEAGLLQSEVDFRQLL